MITETPLHPASPDRPAAPAVAAPAVAPSSGTSRLAVAGLVLALLLPPVGAVLSVVALGRTGPGKRGGRALATVGAVLGSLVTVGGVVTLVALATAGATPDATDRTVTEIEQDLSRLDEELATAFQDKAAVDAGQVPDFSGDIALGGYTAGDLGGSLGVTVVNSGETAYSYTASVAAVSEDGAVLFETAVVVVDEILPGATSAQEAMFFTDIPPDARFELVDYSRSSV